VVKGKGQDVAKRLDRGRELDIAVSLMEGHGGVSFESRPRKCRCEQMAGAKACAVLAGTQCSAEDGRQRSRTTSSTVLDIYYVLASGGYGQVAIE